MLVLPLFFADLFIITLNFTAAGSPTAGSIDYQLTCVVTVIGLVNVPSVTWSTHSGTVISTDTDFTVGAVTGSGPTYTRVLMFNSLKTSQAGEYTCTAELASVTNVSTTNVSVTSMFYMSNG